MSAARILSGTGKGAAQSANRSTTPPSSTGEEFAGPALKLSGLAGTLFGWTPDIFWAATPAEFAALVAALRGDATDPPDAALVAKLMEAFPDG